MGGPGALFNRRGQRGFTGIVYRLPKVGGPGMLFNFYLSRSNVAGINARNALLIVTIA